MNSASIKVQYPDGCRGSWKTRRDGPIANDAAKLGAWLVEIGEQIQEAATTLGQCATKRSAKSDD